MTWARGRQQSARTVFGQAPAVVVAVPELASSTPPRSLMCNGNNTKTGPERFKSRRREALGHHISVLLACRHVENSEITDLHVFTDEVNVELDVLRPFVVHRVRRHVDS